MKRFLLCLFLVMASGMFSQSLHAASLNGEALALSIAPAITEIFLEPGKPQSKIVTLANNTDDALSISGKASRFITIEDISPPDQHTFDASSWIVLDQPDFILQPRGSKQIKVTVTPPLNAEPGSHFATVYFQPLRLAETTQRNRAYIGSKVGLHTLLVVKGDIKQELEATAFEAPLLQQQSPVTFQLGLQNKGNIHLMPTGYIEIRRSGGDVITKLPLPQTLVLPYSTKKIPVVWHTKESIGQFNARAVITYGPQHTKLKEKEVYFLLFPWLWTTVTVIGVVGGGWFVWRTHKRWGRAFRILTNLDEKGHK